MNDAPFDLDNPEDRAELVNDLLHGGCETFAQVIHTMTDWALVALVDGDPSAERLQYVHVALRDRSGQLVDASGRCDPAQMLARWEEFAAGPLAVVDVEWGQAGQRLTWPDLTSIPDDYLRDVHELAFRIINGVAKASHS